MRTFSRQRNGYNSSEYRIGDGLQSGRLRLLCVLVLADGASGEAEAAGEIDLLVLELLVALGLELAEAAVILEDAFRPGVCRVAVRGA